MRVPQSDANFGIGTLAHRLQVLETRHKPRTENARTLGPVRSPAEVSARNQGYKNWIPANIGKAWPGNHQERRQRQWRKRRHPAAKRRTQPSLPTVVGG